MAGLVLEGGTFRGMFSAGVMDAMLDYDINFDYIIGVSAGIANGASYISRQKGRNMEIMRKYRNDSRYLSKRNFIRCGSMFGLDFVYDEIPNKLVPFDHDTYQKFKGKIKIVVTDAKTGEAVYMDGKKLDKKCTLLRATCALPFYFPAITIDGRQYFDGGIADSIPIEKSVLDGNKKNVVILTQPENFVKGQSKSAKLGAKMYKRKFAGMSKAMLERPEKYNKTLDYIKEIEQNTPEDIVVIRPDYAMSSFESDVEKLYEVYMHGFEVAHRNIEKILKLVGE